MATIRTRQEVVLDTLRAMGGDWYSRTQIAEYLHKRVLAPTDIAVLELLAEQGVIKRRLAPTGKEHVSRTEYHLADQEAKHEQGDSRARQKA